MLFTKKGQKAVRIFGIIVALLVATSMVLTYFAYTY
jgi:hypothetical protein